MALLEGLAGGRWALATKTHHTMVDGVGSVDVGHLLLDVSPDAAADTPSPAAARPTSAGRRPAPADQPSTGGPLARLAHAWTGLVPSETIAHATQMGAHGLLHPREALHNARAALSMLVREELHSAPHTSLNNPIGTRRRLEVVRAPLAELKEIKRSLGGTVNDVALAVTASGLRELLTSRGESLPADGLRAMVPMNVRVASEHLALGNRVSSLFVELPMARANAVERYRETVARSGALKSDGDQATGTTAMIELAGLAPPVLHATIAQALYATRLFNLTITNVPGPQQTLYACRSALREVYPLVPLAAAHDLGVAITSYDGNVFFGVVADPDTVPDLDVLVDALGAAVEELLACARGHAPTASEGAASPERAQSRAAETI
jgi:diacylglycerol O-acyltransferase / wax synthase